MHCQHGCLQGRECENQRGTEDRCPACCEYMPHIIHIYKSLWKHTHACTHSHTHTNPQNVLITVCQWQVTSWFHQLKFKILELVTSATIELPTSSPMFLHEEKPIRNVSELNMLQILHTHHHQYTLQIIIVIKAFFPCHCSPAWGLPTRNPS